MSGTAHCGVELAPGQTVLLGASSLLEATIRSSSVRNADFTFIAMAIPGNSIAGEV
ncbi:hypothetical protein QCE47_13470 [Caballeronia sp. LZ025]|uniref:hypothetical protein n=1 Tax=Caballeronia TaxID=1827195 RepID=UPI001FD0DB07|nr:MULTISPECIES: hypothetical protein [Caballeronia]MDR5733346.1 hypothetical protein [Caballeronia sp. LZ025]